jgi:hypothetical protein
MVTRNVHITNKMRMEKTLLKKSSIGDKTKTFLLIVLLTISFFSLFLPHAAAAATEIKSISPEEGPVGTEVRVNGTIETTNGTYQILFDGEKVGNGTIIGNNVTETFVVPHRPTGAYNITLEDLNTTTKTSKLFTIETAYYVRAVEPYAPNQLQEGNSTKIWINITGGEVSTSYFANITVENPNGTIHWATLSFNTTAVGYGNGSIIYPDNFVEAHTNFTGKYNLAFNKTRATNEFIIGLTNATEYGRYQNIDLMAVGYSPNEPVNVTITSTEGTFFPPKHMNASPSGTVSANWAIPANATYGNYEVTVSNSSTPGTVKPIPDKQNFTIAEKLVSCQILTVNLDEEPVEDLEVKTYNAYDEDQQIGLPRRTNINGSAYLQLGAGYYIFRVYWKELQVNQTFLHVAEDMNLTLICQLANIKVEVTEETGETLPFININLTYSYTKDNDTLTETITFETNSTGRFTFRSLLTSLVTEVNYTIEARRYGNLFYTGVIDSLTSTRLVNIICPTYVLTVEVYDSNKLPFRNATLVVYEWSSGMIKDNRSYPFCTWVSTNSSGTTTIDCPFGRYKAKVYLGEVVVGETTIDLLNETQKSSVYCSIFNLTIPVKVIDYFGQAISNIRVEVQPEVAEPSEFTTATDGTATLHIKVGGICQILLYLPGCSEPAEARSMDLDRNKIAEELTFKLGGHVIIGWYLLEVRTFTTILVMIVIVALFAAGLAYRKVSHRKLSKK